MRNLFLRILILVIFFPALWLILFVIPDYNHLVFNIVTILVTLVAGLEVENFFVKKNISTWKFVSPFLGITLPIYSYLEIAGLIPKGYYSLVIVSLIMLVLIRGIIATSKITINKRLEFLSSSLFVIVYPGLFLSYIARLTDPSLFGPEPQFAMLFFLSLVFSNDIAAYISGMLLGKYSRLNLIVSPKKSLIGFLCGFFVSIGIAVLYSYVLADYFLLSLPSALLLGGLIGLSTIAGDLVESVLKRACTVKDSGSLMAGRGGLMDTIDSLLISAPLFYFLFPLLT
ncbi:MAG: phosphatidate cytidylyltransferase [Spirochaetales bacterium]|nr:phosphatidate cytidylyltransferase [Spirochaetales bacterium]